MIIVMVKRINEILLPALLFLAVAIALVVDLEAQQAETLPEITKATIDNPDELLRPGMFARVEVLLASDVNVVDQFLLEAVATRSSEDGPRK